MGLWPSIRAQLNGVDYQAAGYFYAVDGTAYPGAPNAPIPIIDGGDDGILWSGFSSGMVGGLINTQDGLWVTTAIGYPAATLPMWPSVQAGRATLVAAIIADSTDYYRAHGTYEGLAITGSGYSQGSMVWDQVYTEDFLPENGVLHDLLPYLYRVYQYGHIFRTPGIAYGNELAGLSQSITQDGVETGGIGASLDLTADQTNREAPDGKPTIYSCANAGDIYTACSTGLDPWDNLSPEGKVADIFYKIVMQPTFLDVIEAAEVLEEPIQAIEELFHVMQFFVEGMNAPHYQYFPQMDACIGDVLALGNSLPHSGC